MPPRPIVQLESLESALKSAFVSAMRRADDWSDDAETAKVLARVQKRHDVVGSAPDPATIAEAIAHFRRTGEPDGWRGLKRACYGAGMLDQSGWCLLSEKPTRDKLIALADGQSEPRKRVRCYLSLLASYWSFRLDTANEQSKAGWHVLRKWLDERLPKISRDAGRRPGWLVTLEQHQNLLRADPCGRYAAKLLVGDGAELQQAIAGLSIPSDSWVLEEAVMAQMRAASSLSHDAFVHALPGLLSVAMGKSGLSTSKSLQTRCVAALVSRYAKVPGKPEHIGLRDAAVSVIGNPWLKRSSWDASVTDSQGKPDSLAREMVYGWLKRRLIKDFFELLSEDGAGDSRRLDYWLRFEPFIDDMWFALGTNARNRKGEGIEDFRKRAAGRTLILDGTTADNNAFVMRMNEYVAIEFGETGNAFYLFRWDDLPAFVTERLLSGRARADIMIGQLRSQERALKRLVHRDSPTACKSWEQKFDDVICPIVRQKPKHRPAFLPELEKLINDFGVEGEDLRARGGALWLYTDNTRAAFSAGARRLGFQYRSNKGWYREA